MPSEHFWKSKNDKSVCFPPQLNNLEKAVAAAHTFLKKNPTDPSLKKNMNYYKTLFDVEEYLVDHEEKPYEVRPSAQPPSRSRRRNPR